MDLCNTEQKVCPSLVFFLTDEGESQMCRASRASTEDQEAFSEAIRKH
jgi:hypothetical protein